MRCLGLTDERRRCEAEANDSTGYCIQHRVEPDAFRVPLPRGRGGRLAGLKKGLSRGLPVSEVPDDVRLPVPPWLKSSPTPVVVEHLLNDPDSTRRWLAAYALRRRRDATAIDPLWRALQADPSRFVRQQSAVALGKIGARAVMAPLTEGLWYDRDAGVRQACAIALGNLGFRAAAHELARVLEREDDNFVRWDCILALGRLGDKSSERLLTGIAERERAAFIRTACAEALRAIRARESSTRAPRF